MGASTGAVVFGITFSGVVGVAFGVGGTTVVVSPDAVIGFSSGEYLKTLANFLSFESTNSTCMGSSFLRVLGIASATQPSFETFAVDFFNSSSGNVIVYR